MSDLGEVLDALEAERHQLAGLEGAGHPLVGRVEVSLAEAAEVDVHLPIWRGSSVGVSHKFSLRPIK